MAIYMRALIVEKPGTLRYTDVPKPVMRPYDILARVSFTGICGTDIDIYTGETDLKFDYPVRIGHEWSGIVEEVGPETVGFEPGDRVISDTWASCGLCAACRDGNPKGCDAPRSIGTINAWDGAFAEYMRLPYWHLYKIPDNVPLDAATLVEPATIAGNGLSRAGVEPGTSLLVIGSGAIGLSAVGLAKHFGVKKVIFAGRRENKLAIAKKMGADAVINVAKEDLIRRVLEETGKGADRIIEASGSIECVRLGIAAAAPGGRLCPLGFYGADLSGVPLDRLVIDGVSIVTSIIATDAIGKLNEIPSILNMVGEGSLDLGSLITHRIAFDDAAGAIMDSRLYAETKIKMLVDMSI